MEPPPGGERPAASPKPAKLVFERLASEDDEASPASSEDTGRLLEQNVARRLVQCGEEGKTPKATQHITPTQEMNARRRRKRATSRLHSDGTPCPRGTALPAVPCCGRRLLRFLRFLRLLRLAGRRRAAGSAWA